MQAPFVSFLIPIYNMPVELLTACLDSIKALSLRKAEREIIVIDDGSATPPIGQLGDYADDIIYIRKRNEGVAVARNTALQMATGEYIQFIDGDDRLLQAPYEHVLDFARYSHPDAVFFDFCRQTDADSLYDDDAPLSGPELMRTQNIQGSCCCCLFRRSILGTLRFTPGVAYGEDEEFTPQLLLRADSVVRTSAKAYLYTNRSTSAVNAHDPQHTAARLDDVKGVLWRLNRMADTLPTDQRVALQRRVAQLTMDYIYKIIVETRDSQQLDTRLQELRGEGLFPLPDRDYTRKYNWFRRLSSTDLGLKMLMRVLPLMEKER